MLFTAQKHKALLWPPKFCRERKEEKSGDITLASQRGPQCRDPAVSQVWSSLGAPSQRERSRNVPCRAQLAELIFWSMLKIQARLDHDDDVRKNLAALTSTLSLEWTNIFDLLEIIISEQMTKMQTIQTLQTLHLSNMSFKYNCAPFWKTQRRCRQIMKDARESKISRMLKWVS